MKFFHKWHDESKADWSLVSFDYVENVKELKNTKLYHAHWIMKCKCGYEAERVRSYFVWNGQGKRYSCDKTYEECITEAGLYKGDNYHI